MATLRLSGPPGEVAIRALEFDRPVTADWLRALPLGQMTAWANLRDAHTWLVIGGDMAGEVAFDESQFAAAVDIDLDLGLSAYPRSKPDGFYRDVARLHTELRAAGNRRPAHELAEANDVPVSTVHRWMKEARRRGVMPGTEET